MEELPLISDITPLALLALVLYFGWRSVNKGFDIFANHLQRMVDALEELNENLQDCLNSPAIRESLQKRDES